MALRRNMSAIPDKMKAVVVNAIGPASVLKVETSWPVPQGGKPKDGEVLVRNQYAGLNFIDTYFRSGLYKRDPPFISGQEGGGVVAVTTPKAEAMGFRVGDRVVYSVFDSYAEYTAVPADKLVAVPANVSLEVATACMIQGLTAHYLVCDAHAQLLKPGDWCLIHGVGGGTGQWTAQVAKIMGYKVIGTTSKSKEAIARATGADELVTRDAAGWNVDVVQRVMEITGGQGVKCVIDGVGKSTWDISLNSLARRGVLISFGNASGPVPDFPILRLSAKSAYITRPRLMDYTVDREELLRRAGDLFRWVGEGRLKISVDKVLPLDKAVEGHEYLEAGKSTGKVLFKV